MKEQSDDREREFKFEYGGDPAVLVEGLRSVALGRPLITFPPRAVMDLYFDNGDRDLLATGSTLRLRKRRINPGWTLNFKAPPLTDEAEFLDRREVITRVKVDEALGYRDRRIPGLAWDCALAFARAHAFDEVLRPAVHLVTWRTGWTIRPGDLGNRQSNYLCLFHDQVTAYDITGQRPELIIRYGALDYSSAVPGSASFAGYEIESSGRLENEEAEAVRALRTVARRLTAEPGVRPVTYNKYQRAAELLGTG
ncbi:CYTH domain-containing protein [Streptomyces sp. MP131-18]|uniref:CYTH domain-containing protein n=1 Tax=Streptomyces sp. MP131-18 TaxID=1857892 RepID=UPI00097C2BFE|nr:CYTH domain-containing protein [Streptomyces sp. MP131-18]ONK15812.1 hypothetical protein STBA_66530 [Streptomyces sp. MP131-18]